MDASLVLEETVICETVWIDDESIDERDRYGCQKECC